MLGRVASMNEVDCMLDVTSKEILSVLSELIEKLNSVRLVEIESNETRSSDNFLDVIFKLISMFGALWFVCSVVHEWGRDKQGESKGSTLLDTKNGAKYGPNPKTVKNSGSENCDPTVSEYPEESLKPLPLKLVKSDSTGGLAELLEQWVSVQLTGRKSISPDNVAGFEAVVKGNEQLPRFTGKSSH